MKKISDPIAHKGQRVLHAETNTSMDARIDSIFIYNEKLNTKRIFEKIFALFSILILAVSFASAQTVVNSLTQLQPYLNDNNVNVKLSPGTYTVTANDVSSGTIGQYWSGSVHLGNTFNVFLFEGNNSTYDFTGVTINIETATAQSVGNVDFYEVRIIGNNNVIQNLTVVDDGSVDDAPSSRATNVVMDGENNELVGCHFTVRGSYPYGYGDIFGKSGNNIINHNKRSACLIRGKSNLVKDSTFICRSYGHGIFFQGAEDPMVEGCYVEGEIRSTDDVLAEAGTGSPADNVNFQTIFGFNMNDLNGNYYFSLQEDGIRSYNAGETVINGVEYSRGVTNATVTDSTVVKMRSGVTIGWASGTKYVENCTVLACETGYWVGSNTDVVNCDGDASIGALLSEDVGRSNSNIELTLLDNYVSPLNGAVTNIYYAGSGHVVTLNNGTTSTLSNIDIEIGGERLGHRWMNGNGSTNLPLNFSATNIDFTNNTPYSVLLGSNSSSCNVTSCGPVTNNGTGNSVSSTSDCGGSGNNVALGGSASQSSTNHGGVASLAIDGNTSGVWNNSSVTHTSNEAQPWWEVDLGASYEIDEIVVWGRTDSCCVNRLSDYDVSILDDNSNVVWTNYQANAPSPSVSLNANGSTGRYVMVQLRGTDVLSLAEVQVYGDPSGGLSSQDIGSVAASGSYSENGGNYAVNGSGADIWGTSDEFHYVYQSLDGDGEIVARVNSVQNTNSWAKAGVMIRESLNANSKHATAVITPGNGASFQRRTSTSGSSTENRAAGVTAPRWVRLTRSGNTFTAAYSSNGSSWTTLGSDTISMSSNVYVGLCVTSHNDGTVCTAQFDNLSISEGIYDPNVVGEWSFDSVSSSIVYDSGAYGNDGTRNGGTVISGNTGDAMDFDGVNDDIDLPAAAFSTISDEITISMWVNGDGSQPASDTIFRAVDSNGYRVLNIHLPWSNSNVYWDAGNNGTSSYDRIQGGTVSSNFEGSWNHWVFVKNATSGDMVIYLNGSVFQSGTGKTQTMSGITNVRLGSAITNQYYSGAIDEVVIYDIALSASEVSALYNSY
ncbi:discoidin domain-containing protein [Puniceicoccaceae bacterium K14]|nr:discoidin domain-containing protein [Puniceicoccaceae bacterium K14]